MPTWFPENNTSLASDSDHRSLIKWNSILFDANGNVGLVPYPEGTRPLSSDDEHRSEVKIAAIYAVFEFAPVLSYNDIAGEMTWTWGGGETPANWTFEKSPDGVEWVFSGSVPGETYVEYISSDGFYYRVRGLDGVGNPISGYSNTVHAAEP